MRWMLAVALLALLAGCSSPATETSSRDASPTVSKTLTSRATIPGPACPGHWHATFAIFLPGEGGEPHRVDFVAPRSGKGRIYYDYASGSALQMTLAVHMRQSGDGMGNASLAPAQWHMESEGQCVQVQQALRAVDVEAAADRLALAGGHTQIAGQGGTFSANETSPLRWWLQSQGADGPEGVWTWRESNWTAIEAYELQDGESLLVALGSYSEEQVAAMQRAIPVPMSRMPL